MNASKKKKLIFVIVSLFLVYFTVTFIDQQKLLDSKSNQIKDIEEKIANEQKVNEELNRQKEIINSDEYVEKVAREKLGMVKGGEKIFIDTNR